MPLFRKSKSATRQPPAPATPAEAAARVRADRDVIAIAIAKRVCDELEQTVRGFGSLGLTGRIKAPSQAELQQVLIDYPIWAIGQLIAQIGGVVGPEGDAAREAAESAARRRSENMRHVVESGSLEYLTDDTKRYSTVQNLADAAVDGYLTNWEQASGG